MGLWTQEHLKTLLPAAVLMVAAALVLRHFTGKKNEAIRMLPIRIIAVLLIFLEVGKQAVSMVGGYDLYSLPLHFCSLALFSLPVMAFYRGKHQNAVSGVTTAVCASISLLMLIYPSLIYSADNINGYFAGYLNFHTVTFHNLVLFAFILILTLELHTPKRRGNTKPLILFVLAFCVVSATMAMVLKTNYANFYECNIPFFEGIRIGAQPVLGVWGAQLLYIAILSALNVLFSLMSYQLYRLLHRLCGAKSVSAR